jgi:hypothetical protein
VFAEYLLVAVHDVRVVAAYETRTCVRKKMALVYKIVIQCPVTGRVIDRGIRTAGREALSSGLFQDGTVSCPYCSQMHALEDNSYLDMDRAGSVNGLWRPNR